MPDSQGDAPVSGGESDARLGAAFRAATESPVSELPEEVRDRIWLAVSGELPPEARQELVDRLSHDAAAAEAWRIASDLWLGMHAAQGQASAPRPAVRWNRPFLAAAAALLVMTVFGVTTLLNRPGGDEFRAPRDYVVESRIAAEAALPRDAFRLRWTPGPDGSRYQVRVMSENLQLLAAAADLTVPELVVAPAALAALPAGAIVLWQIDVSLPSGERITSPTFVNRIR
jgi:hypothetical protein